MTSSCRQKIMFICQNMNGNRWRIRYLAGKTGTAELKATKEDTSGTEIGWFTVFTTDRDAKNPILLISMVENVKDIGGSGYVVEKDKAILDEYLGNE